MTEEPSDAQQGAQHDTSLEALSAAETTTPMNKHSAKALGDGKPTAEGIGSRIRSGKVLTLERSAIVCYSWSVRVPSSTEIKIGAATQDSLFDWSPINVISD